MAQPRHEVVRSHIQSAMFTHMLTEVWSRLSIFPTVTTAWLVHALLDYELAVPVLLFGHFHSSPSTALAELLCQLASDDYEIIGK